MDKPSIQTWLGQLETVLESLRLIDPSLVPPSFAEDVLGPVLAGKSLLPEVAEQHRFIELIEQLTDLATTAQHRTWFFWDSAGDLFAKYVQADSCRIFREGSEGSLNKLHPLESEEETQDIRWPLEVVEGVAPQPQEGFAQSFLVRVGVRHQSPLVLQVLTTRMLPRIKQERLEKLSQAGRLLFNLLRGFMPKIKMNSAMDIVGGPFLAEERSGILGRDPGFLQALALVEQAAKSEASVYLKGESGTGKELFARHLHQLSDRADGPFIPINCSAIPHELIESEMFGHEKGAFTGAYYRKIGKVEQAHGGTLFLDEIGEMPLAFQAKLLRYLQEKKFNRVGGNQSIHSDARIIVATHRDLKVMVQQTSFREDLFYRIHVIPITIPPLRDRGGDIRFLSERFFAKYIAKSRSSRRQVDESVFDALVQFSFPGNVRELDNIVHRTVVMTKKPVISAEDLPEEVLSASSGMNLKNFRFHPFEKFDTFIPDSRATLKLLKKEVEQVSMSYMRDLDRRFLLNLLRESGGSARKAAEKAEINRTLFYKLLKRAGIDISLLGKAES